MANMPNRTKGKYLFQHRQPKPPTNIFKTIANHGESDEIVDDDFHLQTDDVHRIIQFKNLFVTEN